MTFFKYLVYYTDQQDLFYGATVPNVTNFLMTGAVGCTITSFICLSAGAAK